MCALEKKNNIDSHTTVGRANILSPNVWSFHLFAWSRKRAEAKYRKTTTLNSKFHSKVESIECYTKKNQWKKIF